MVTVLSRFSGFKGSEKISGGQEDISSFFQSCIFIYLKCKYHSPVLLAFICTYLLQLSLAFSRKIIPKGSRKRHLK